MFTVIILERYGEVLYCIIQKESHVVVSAHTDKNEAERLCAVYNANEFMAGRFALKDTK